jgi:GAF domain-containing protein
LSGLGDAPKFGSMSAEDHADDFQQLHELANSTGDIKGFLDGMTGFAAAMMTRATGSAIECAVTLRRRKHSATIAGSSDDAILLDGIEQRQHDGPCVQALKTGTSVLLDDVARDQRWPQHCDRLAAAGCRSALGVPLKLGRDAKAVLNFFAPATGVFTTEVIQDAESFAEMTSPVLGVALRIATAEQLADDLKAALKSRTAINLACGVIMAQNRCGQHEAFDILRHASSTRNQKLHDLAEEIISNVSGTSEVTTHFED